MFKSVKDCEATLILRSYLYRNSRVQARDKVSDASVDSEHLIHFYLWLDRLGTICSPFWL